MSTEGRLGQLWPRPRRARTLAGTRLALGAAPRVSCDGDRDEAAVRLAADRVAGSLVAAGASPAVTRGEANAEVALRLDPAVAGIDGDEGYRLAVGSRRATVTARALPGLLHGAATLAQWIGLHADRRPGEAIVLGGLEVDDAPDFAHRGVMLDISRDKVPTMATLRRLIDRLASWKINQLQLYVEHTFAYRGHERVWRDASPLTPQQARELDAYCRDRCVELVPNQNSFGHLHRWLIHEPYRALAECPEGIDHPFSDEREPYSLCPTDPGSLALLGELYDQLLPCFAGSDQLNVGLDETFDLGKGRSRAACEARGRHEVYLEFLAEVHRLARDRGRRMQFWGDIIIERPDLIDRLPADAIALEWGYEADHPFAEHAERFGRSGRAFYVCPGTSSWNSVAGRPQNAIANLALAAREGLAHGAAGYLVTDWGDFGHLQPLPASYLGLLAGAGFGWNAAAAGDDPHALPWAELLDRHALDGAAGAGEALIALGDAHLRCSARPKNGTALFFGLLDASAAKPLAFVERKLRGLTAGSLAGALEAVGDARHALEGARLAGDDGAILAEELRWASDLLAFCCRLGMARYDGLGADDGPRPPSELSGPLRLALGRVLEPLLDGHRAVWLARNREGGRADSVRRLERLAGRLAGR